MQDKRMAGVVSGRLCGLYLEMSREGFGLVELNTMSKWEKTPSFNTLVLAQPPCTIAIRFDIDVR